MRLDGRSVLLTGASGGLGNEIARKLHKRGARLAVSGRKVEALEALREELGGAPRVLPADLADADGPADLAARTGAVDVLVANAGLPGTGRLDELTPDEIDRAIAVNLRGTVQLARALLPDMIQRRSGHLVFISSMSGKVASAHASVYCATKFGLRGFSLSLREELRGTGVGVSAIFPGPVSDAGMWADAAIEAPRALTTSSPEEVADAVLRAIERDKPEIDVASPLVRFGGVLAGVSPRAVAAITRAAGGVGVAERLADAQRDKR